MCTEMESEDRDQASRVLRGVAGSLAIVEYALHDLTSNHFDIVNADKRIGKLSKAIGACAVEAVEYADELNPGSRPWLWAYGAVHDRDHTRV